MTRVDPFWICAHHMPPIHISVDVVQQSAPQYATAEFDLTRLPYPVALTAERLQNALAEQADVLKTLFRLKDCFEATVKYLGVVLLSDYFASRACTPERNVVLLEKMIRPSLGHWVNHVVGDISRWLAADGESLGVPGTLFVAPPPGRGGKPKPTELLIRCEEFVAYRNDALGHGALRRESAYRKDLDHWLPLIGELINAVAALDDWRLVLPIDTDRCQVWMGPQPPSATQPGNFRPEQIGHFVLRGPAADQLRPVRDLHPFLIYLPDAQQQERLHFYDSIYRYQDARKEISLLEYDEGFKQARSEPVPALELVFTAELLSQAFKRYTGRMEVIEGRVASFGELLVEHTDIVGRGWAVEKVEQFLQEHDRGLLVIEGEPGKGKTALLAHLIEDVLGHYSPSPIHFFYRRTAGITDPDVCVKSLYYSLLEAHDITESPESREQNSPEVMFNKLTRLLHDTIGLKSSPSRPQLIFIDALDEAGMTAAGQSAFQRLPENLPAGVYFIASTRPVQHRALLARRAHLDWLNLDDPDFVQDNLRDGAHYVQQELVASSLPSNALHEVARVGAGNFLVLKLLCRHIAVQLDAPEVDEFLRRLATNGAKDQLGFIYEEFWGRITGGLDRHDIKLLCDVAGLLLYARAPLNGEIICSCLGLRAGDWDFALRHLAEYLTAIEYEEAGEREVYYRIYHESFADFLQSKVAVDRTRFENRLADCCFRWSELPKGRGRRYALRFAASHLCATQRWEALESLLTDIFFLEAKTQAGLVFDLAVDFQGTVAALPAERPQRRILRLFEEALRRDIYFIHLNHKDYTQGLFQCLWNSAWWYDCPQAGQHYERSNYVVRPLSWLSRTIRALMRTSVRNNFQVPPWQQPGPKLHKVLERWREQKEQASPDLLWLRALRPPGIHLGTAQLAVLRGHEKYVHSLSYSPDGVRIVSGSVDKTVRVWDAASGAELAVLRGHEHDVNSVSHSPDGARIVSGSWDNTVRLWDAETLECLEVIQGSGDVLAIAAGPSVFPFRALRPGQETVIEESSTATVVARYPYSIECLQTAHSGTAWAGNVANHIHPYHQARGRPARTVTVIRLTCQASRT